MLDFDADGFLSESDLTVFMQQIAKHQFRLGDRVRARSSAVNHRGVLRFIGEPQFSQGIWCGIELDEPTGKNNGTIQDVHYFDAQPNHGVFVQFPALQLESHFIAAHEILLHFLPSSANQPTAPSTNISDSSAASIDGALIKVPLDAFCAKMLQEHCQK
eukprot:jgi/Hompol1/6499/HPOL_002276-RA